MSLFFAEHVRRNLNYDASQLIRPRPTRPGEIIQQEIPKFATYEQQDDWIRHRIERISTTDHLLAIREEIHSGQKIRDDTNEAKLKSLVKYLKANDLSLTLRAKNIDYWLNVRGTTVTGTVLEAMEYCDF